MCVPIEKSCIDANVQNCCENNVTLAFGNEIFVAKRIYLHFIYWLMKPLNFEFLCSEIFFLIQCVGRIYALAHIESNCRKKKKNGCKCNECKIVIILLVISINPDFYGFWFYAEKVESRNEERKKFVKDANILKTRPEYVRFHVHCHFISQTICMKCVSKQT